MLVKMLSVNCSAREPQSEQISKKRKPLKAAPILFTKTASLLKEARESNYWLKLISATEKFEENVGKGIKELEDESLELANIIAKIIVSTKK